MPSSRRDGWLAGRTRNSFQSSLATTGRATTGATACPPAEASRDDNPLAPSSVDASAARRSSRRTPRSERSNARNGSPSASRNIAALLPPYPSPPIRPR